MSNNEKSKSILDGIPVVEVNYPQNRIITSGDSLDIVGECPTCGGPVYGYKKIKRGERAWTQFSCDCRYLVKGTYVNK